MIFGNKLYKQSDVDVYNGEEVVIRKGDVVRVTTDDIPEGNENKYSLEYPDGKSIGDIVIRFSPEELPGHKRLFRPIGNELEPLTPAEIIADAKVYEYDAPEFYAYCLDCKNKAGTEVQASDPYYFFSFPEEDYYSAIQNKTYNAIDVVPSIATVTNVIPNDADIAYCPYFVTSSEDIYSYEVKKDDMIGYTPIPEEGTEYGPVVSGYIFKDVELTEVYSTKLDGWKYTENRFAISANYVIVPTLPAYIAGSGKSYYFVVTKSRVVDEATSIRQIEVKNEAIRLGPDDSPYVKNLGNKTNQLLEFAIPSGKTPTISIGTVESGEIPAVINSGSDTEAVFNFVFAKGDKGDAGGTLVLDYLGDSFPSSGTLNQLFYSTTNNRIYIYNGTTWIEYKLAVKDMLYVANNIIYYFNGTQLIELHSNSKAVIDNNSLVYTNNALEVQGIRYKEHIGDSYTAPGTVRYDWIGTEADWEYGRSHNLIPDNYVCFIIDD